MMIFEQTFSTWPEDIHADPDQIKRQKSALEKKMTPIEIDKDQQTGVFRGSKKNYNTTLNYCQCVDYGRRKLPCKHIYRLAMELGLFIPPDGEAICVAKENLSSAEIVEKTLTAISVLSEEEQEDFAHACYECGNDNKHWRTKMRKELAQKLQCMGLIVVLNTSRVYSFVALDDSISSEASRIHRAYRKLHPRPDDFSWWNG